MPISINNKSNIHIYIYIKSKYLNIQALLCYIVVNSNFELRSNSFVIFKKIFVIAFTDFFYYFRVEKLTHTTISISMIME